MSKDFITSIFLVVLVVLLQSCPPKSNDPKPSATSDCNSTVSISGIINHYNPSTLNSDTSLQIQVNCSGCYITKLGFQVSCVSSNFSHSNIIYSDSLYDKDNKISGNLIPFSTKKLMDGTKYYIRPFYSTVNNGCDSRNIANSALTLVYSIPDKFKLNSQSPIVQLSITGWMVSL